MAAQEKPDCPKPKPVAPAARVADAKFWTAMGVLGTSAAADYIATRQVLDRGGYEKNPIFGRHPSVARQVAIGGAYFAGEVLLAYELKKFGRRHRWARHLWLIDPVAQSEEHMRSLR